MGKQKVMKINNRRTKIRPSWSDLPIDLLGETMEKLCDADKVHLSAVCKNWMLSYTYHQKKIASRKLPELLTCKIVPKHNSCLFELYNPFDQQPIENHTVKNSKSVGWTLTSKCGWVFFSREKKRKRINRTEFFLFSLSTKKIISLPDLEHDELIMSTTIITFSSDPYSPDCVFFVLRQSDESENITISTLSLRDGRWITTKLVRKIIYSIESVVCMQGTLYCVSDVWNLAAYKVASQEWIVLERTVRKMARWLRHYDLRLLEMDGDLLLVKLNKNYSKACTIQRFDFQRKQWFHQISLRDRALFIGRNGSFSVPVFEGIRHIILDNRVYYLGYEGGCKVYSLEKDNKYFCKLVYCEEGSRFNGWNVNGLCAEFIWIEPRDHFENQPKSLVGDKG